MKEQHNALQLMMLGFSTCLPCMRSHSRSVDRRSGDRAECGQLTYLIAIDLFMCGRQLFCSSGETDISASAFPLCSDVRLPQSAR